jgi:hypothetical protein
LLPQTDIRVLHYGDKLTAVPVPLRLTVCGLPCALSVILSVPVRVPVATGLNATLILQLAFWRNRTAASISRDYKIPDALTLLMAKANVPVFFNVTVWKRRERKEQPKQSS